MSKPSVGRHSRHAVSSTSPYLILFILLLSTIGLIVMFHLLPNEHLVQSAAEHNMVRNIKSLNEAQMPANYEQRVGPPMERSINVIKPHTDESIRNQQQSQKHHSLHSESKIQDIRNQISRRESEDAGNNIGSEEADSSAVSGSINHSHEKATDNIASTVVKTNINLQGANKLGEDTVLLIICSNRPDYLKKTLSFVLQFHPRASVPIVISQDGDNGEVNRVIEEAEKQFKALSTGSSITLEHVHHRADRNIRYENGYFKLADHFKFALNYVFHERSLPAQRVIILEEDLQIAPDFFEYFAATKDLLDNDPTLLAVSAWNDNGFKTLVEDNRVIYRSDFFPGLGWMMTRKLWDELSVKWPRAYWDDWLREPKQRQNRHILRPEVCRTLHFGIHGVSNAQYSEYLESIRLNEEYIKFTEMDLSYLSSEQRWDDFYLDHQVRTAKLMSFGQLRNLLESGTRGSANDHVKVIYGTYDEGSRAPDSYTTYCHFLGCMNNVKAGVPRTAYKGVTTIHKAGYTIHLVPKSFK